MISPDRSDLWSPDGFKTWLLQLLTPSNYSLYSSIGYFCHRLPSITFLYQHLCKISFTDGFKLYDKFIFVKPSVRLTFKVNCPLRTSVNPVLLRQPHSCLNVLFGQPHSCSSLSSQGLYLVARPHFIFLNGK